jgi:hypothetical protein
VVISIPAVVASLGPQGIGAADERECPPRRRIIVAPIIVAAIAMSRAATVAMTLAIPIATGLAVVPTMPDLDEGVGVLGSLHGCVRRYRK